MTYIFGSIITIYCLLIIWLFIGYLRIPKSSKNFKTPRLSFSIIIPFRNEAENLNKILISIQKLNYPISLFEVIFVNDSSDDNGKDLINLFSRNNENLQIRVIENKRLSKSPKKDAIKTAIEYSKFDWIITTDADCKLPKEWLNHYNSNAIKKESVLMAGGISTQPTNFLQIFELFDLSSLLSSTIGSFGNQIPIMCNGANLCYKKSVFFDLKGFDGNEHLATGDDFFLLQKIHAVYPKKIQFIKSSDHLVITSPASSWKELINQRIRWGSKTTNANNFIKLIGSVIILMNLTFIFTFVSSLMEFTEWHFFVIILAVKSLVDLLLITLSFILSKQIKYLIFYPIISCIHPILMCVFSIGSLLKNNYNWKGRVHST